MPDTKVSLVPPEGLKLTERFPGFSDEETSSSILITELPAPYSEFTNGITKEAFAKRGMSLLSRREVSLNGRPGILLRVRQKARSAEYHFIMQGFAPRKEQEKYLAVFTRIAKSFRKK